VIPEAAARWVVACGPVRWDGHRWLAHYRGEWIDGDAFITMRVLHLLRRWYRPGDLDRVSDALRSLITADSEDERRTPAQSSGTA